MKKINLDEPQKVRAIGNGAHVFVPKALVGQKVYIETEKRYEESREVARQPGEQVIEDTPLPEPVEIAEMQEHITPRKKTEKKSHEEKVSDGVKKLEDPDVEAERHFLECLKNAKNNEIRAKLIRAAEQQFGRERVKVLVDAASLGNEYKKRKVQFVC